MALEPQAALEVAVLAQLRLSTGEGGLAYDPKFCGRRYKGYPPPLCPVWYAAVWSDLSVQSGANRAMRSALDESHSVFVTITVPCSKPFDRWIEHQDLLERKRNEIRAMVHGDAYDCRIANAANELAECRRADLAAGATRPVGFWQGLAYEGADAIQECGPDWFQGDPEAARPMVGLAQRLRFSGACRMQAGGNAE